jgi:hypothetical protein
MYEKLNEKYFNPKLLKSNSFNTEIKSKIIGIYLYTIFLILF